MGYYDSLPSTLFRRCVTGCAPDTPACPACSANEICSLVPPTCAACQKTICVPAPASASTPTPSSSTGGPNVGAIAGGVIAGVVAIAVVTYFVWKHCIKAKRPQYEQEVWTEGRDGTTAAEKDFAAQRNARNSTYTVASIASTVLTRASNIIQIAYIPGVTNRSAPSTPGLLVPPVPPIPIALAPATTPRHEQEHFFMPGNLRDSTYSGISDRTSYARTSVASTIYGKNVVVSSAPAQTVIRGKAAVVSVKSNNSSAPELAPPVPNVDYDKYGLRGPPSPAFSVGSTFLSSAGAAVSARPQVVRIASGPKMTEEEEEEEEVNARSGLLPRDSAAITIIDDTPTVEQGPFRDPPSTQHTNSNSLSAVVDRSQKSPDSKDTTPFGDEHEVKEG